MNAECARPTCEEPAQVLLAFDPRTARAWLRDLDNGDPSMGLLLCTEHAESTSVPVSWEIVDERRTVPEFSSQMYDSEPSFDDIFPPRAGYSNWDNLPYHDTRPAAAQPRHDPGVIGKRGDDGGRFSPRNNHDEPAFDDLGGPALDPLRVSPPIDFDAESVPGPVVGSSPEPAVGAGREPASIDGAWYDADPGRQPEWLERAESLDFGLDDYYDPYLDDPELTDASDPHPSLQEPSIAVPPDTSVAPIVRPGSPDEQVPATELLAAASVEPPQPIPSRLSRSPVPDPQGYKDAVRLPERADVSARDAPENDAEANRQDDASGGLAASGTDGAPFPPHPGARSSNE